MCTLQLRVRKHYIEAFQVVAPFLFSSIDLLIGYRVQALCPITSPLQGASGGGLILLNHGRPLYRLLSHFGLPCDCLYESNLYLSFLRCSLVVQQSSVRQLGVLANIEFQ